MSSLKSNIEPQDHVLGPEYASCALVEYGDYQCPHCAHALQLSNGFGSILATSFALRSATFP